MNEMFSWQFNLFCKLAHRLINDIAVVNPASLCHELCDRCICIENIYFVFIDAFSVILYFVFILQRRVTKQVSCVSLHLYCVSLSLLCCLAFKASPCCKCGNAGCQTGTHRSKLGATKLDRADQWPLNAKQQAQYFVYVQCHHKIGLTNDHSMKSKKHNITKYVSVLCTMSPLDRADLNNANQLQCHKIGVTLFNVSTGCR